MISFFSFFVSVKGSTLLLANWWATKQLFKINFWLFCRQSLSTIPSHFCRPSVSHGQNSGKFYADGSISRRHERFIRVAYWISAAEKVPNDNITINGFNNFPNTGVVYFDQWMHACACVSMVENDQKHSKISKKVCIDTRKRCSAKAVHINCFEKPSPFYCLNKG